jgi:acyl carrier protein
MPTTVKDAVISYLQENLHPERGIQMDTTLVDDLGLDSLDHVEMTINLEEALDITITDDEIVTSSVTVGELIENIRKRYNID